MTKTLFVGNLPWSVTDEELTEKFQEVAEVISARIITNRNTGKSRGFGFVEVPDDLSETIINAFDQTEWRGRQIRVSEAQPRAKRINGRAGHQRRRF